MMADLQNNYDWVLDTLVYETEETLIKAIKPGIIDPAIEKHNQLRSIKAKKTEEALKSHHLLAAGSPVLVTIRRPVSRKQ